MHTLLFCICKKFLKPDKEISEAAWAVDMRIVESKIGFKFFLLEFI